MNSAHKTLPRNFKIEFDVIDILSSLNFDPKVWFIEEFPMNSSVMAAPFKFG